MRNKLLLWDQNYDITNFYEIIDRDDLEDYIQEWIEKYIKHNNTYATHKYLLHKINKESYQVQIKFEHGVHGSRGDGSQFIVDEYWTGFDFIELDKMPIWKKDENKN